MQLLNLVSTLSFKAPGFELTLSLKAPGLVSTLENLKCDFLVFTFFAAFKRINLCRYASGANRAGEAEDWASAAAREWPGDGGAVAAAAKG